MRFTIFGGRGFIGAAIARYLQEKGYDVYLPSRSDSIDNLKSELGHVIYCIGLTGDFRVRPFETVEAHICKLANLLKSSDFDSWLYLSSTRIYSGIDSIAKESARLPVFPDADGIYDISKLLGESLCLSLKNEKIRVARISNVYGEGLSTNTFLGSIIDDVKRRKALIINESPDSSKDYIFIEDAIDILVRIATSGKDRLYNVASGEPVKHSHIAKIIENASQIPVSFKKGASKRAFPPIDISKITQEFSFFPRLLVNELPIILN
jgi:nucleoside-diphosphate-sugar epimerase